MDMPELEFSALGIEHESAILQYLSEFHDAGEGRISAYFGKPDWTHPETVKKLEAWSKAQDLDGWVPNTTRFLIDNGRILGNYNFRHELTKELMLCGGHCGYSVRPSERRKGYATMLLGHAKEFGRTLGLQRMLVTCSVDNLGSSGAIKNNGGTLENVVDDPEEDGKLARYWITL